MTFSRCFRRKISIRVDNRKARPYIKFFFTEGTRLLTRSVRNILCIFWNSVERRMRKCSCLYISAWTYLSPAWFWHVLASRGTWVAQVSAFQWMCLRFFFFYWSTVPAVPFILLLTFFAIFGLSLLTDKPTVLGNAVAQKLEDGPSTLCTVKPFGNSPRQNLFLRGYFACTLKARRTIREIRRCFQISAASWL